MFLAQVTFGRHSGTRREREALKETAESYLATLLRQGQIYGEYLVAWCNDNLVAYTHVARPDSLESRHHSEWAAAALDTVVNALGQPPALRIIDDDVPKHFRSWKRSKSLYVFTHAFDDTSPVCCGDIGTPIPLYLLPLTQQSREDFYFWARSYRYHDSIWLGSAALEIPAYKQMAEPASDLSKTGRELCATIEAATGKPTYYFLHRYWGRSTGEATRPCPLCGRKWHSRSTPLKSRPYHQFHFRCQPCRLVAHCADSYDDERHARIGEFKGT